MKITEHKLYSTWIDMRRRCNNLNRHNYKYYGARGIKVCKRWNRSGGLSLGFKAFVKDVGPRPKGYELDRINNNGNYTPKNCKWVSHKENMNNRRKYKTREVIK